MLSLVSSLLNDFASLFSPQPCNSAARHGRRAALGVTLAAIACGLCTPAQTSISPGAYQEINQRAAADQNSFYVYLDQDSGFNHGFASGYMASTPANQTTISVNTGCIDSAVSVTGCSTYNTIMDQVRGTVLSITFAAQTAENWAGFALEEPQGWLSSPYGIGYDLTGATSVSFDVRSPNGAQVEFGVGGCLAPFTPPLSSAWTTVTLALNTTSLSCTPDLTDTHLLFEVLTNNSYDLSGATVLLDNIQFTSVPTSQQSALSFPLANQTFGVVPQQAAPIPPDQSLRNVTTIYEPALAEFVLLSRGNPQDLQNAKTIADTFDYALNHDNHDDPIPVAPGGYAGLHNGYESGDIALLNNQLAPLTGLAGDVRLAGFTDPTLCAPSGYCYMLDGATGGNNAFAILALANAYAQLGDVKYLNDALTIGNWIVGNLKDTSGTGFGGYFTGYGDGGIVPPKPLLTSKSTRDNAAIFAAFNALAYIESGQGNSRAATAWTDAANVAGDFVRNMYANAWTTYQRINAGTVPAGTSAAPGICPTGTQWGNDVTNICEFLDANTFYTLTMFNSGGWSVDWMFAGTMMNSFAQSIAAAGTTYQGLNNVFTPDSGANGIAWEFTGQVVEALNFLLQNPVIGGFDPSLPHTYLAQIAQAQASAPFGDGLGIVAATLEDGDTLPPLQLCLQTPDQCIPERVGLAATAWAILAERGVNVFSFSPVIQFQNPPIGNLDAAVDNKTGLTAIPQTGFLLVRGWVEDPSGISPLTSVLVYIDGVPIGGPTLGLARPDVAAYFNNPAYAHSGYELTFPGASLGIGTHAVTVTAIDSNSLSTTFGPLTITVTTNLNPDAPTGNLDAAVDSTTGLGVIATGGTLLVRGWVVDPLSGASPANVNVYIDGNLLGTPTLGLARPDVAAYYNNPAYANSGYQLTVPAASLPIGTRAITVVVIDSGGLSNIFGPLTIDVAASLSVDDIGMPFGNLDSAVDSTTCLTTIPQTNSLLVRGWIAAPAGSSSLANVNVYSDGNLIGAPVMGLARPDVVASFNDANYSNSGFQLTLPAAMLGLGTHAITVVAVGAITSEAQLITLGPLTITVTPAPGPLTPIGNLDSAVDSTTGLATIPQTDSLLLLGWAGDPTDGAPMANVKIYIDGNLIGAPTLGLARPDVAAYFNNTNYANSGFQLTLSAASLSIGAHAVTVVAIDFGGHCNTFGPLTITVTSGSNPPFGNLDEAVDSSTGLTTIPQSDSLLAQGWVVDPTDGAPMANVKVYIDGTPIGAPALGLTRPDVVVYFDKPAYNYSGYQLTLSAASLSIGTHAITVIAVDSGGRSTAFGSLTITVQ